MGVAARLPVRGAVAHGDMYIREGVPLFVGKPLTDAHDLEQAQAWVGVALHASASQRYREMFDRFDERGDLDAVALSHIFMEYGVPLKDGTACTMRIVNWRFQWRAEKGTKHHLGDGADAGAQLKIRNTLEFARHVRSLFSNGDPNVVPQRELSLELRRFFASDTPLFTGAHGDDY